LAPFAEVTLRAAESENVLNEASVAFHRAASRRLRGNFQAVFEDADGSEHSTKERQPVLNLQIAKAYLAGADPNFAKTHLAGAHGRICPGQAGQQSHPRGVRDS